MSGGCVVTGVGVVSPVGTGADAYWDAQRAGACGIGRIARYDTGSYPLALGGEVSGFEAADYMDSRIIVQTDRFTQLALAAAELALRDAKLVPDDVPPFSFGVVTASCAGGVEFGQHEIERLWSEGPRHVGPYQSIAWFYAASTGQISIRHRLRGPCGVLITDEAGGLDAVAHAALDLAQGAKAMLAGGAEAPFAPFSMACQYGTGLLSYATDPGRAYRPFAADACGFVPAEAGAMLVIEDEDSATARGATARARITGHGATFTGPGRHEDSAAGLAHAARTALDRAGCGPQDVDVVFADALGVPEADRAEFAAISMLLGTRRAQVPVTAPKTGTGRAYAAAAALDLASAVATVEQGLIPPTPNASGTPFDLDLVTGHARRAPVSTALVLARGLSGSNSAMVVQRA